MKGFEATEHQIMNAIIGFLRFKGYYCMRLNSGKYSVGEGRSRRFIMGQEAGTPDLLAFRGNWSFDPGPVANVALLFIEVKRPGKKATPLQIAKMKELEEYGARCIIASSMEEVKEVLEK